MGQEVERKLELKKHAAAIHCVNSLSLLQRKISNVLLYHAYPELPHKDEHEISIKQLCIAIGYKGNNHAAIKESLRGLITTLVEWNVIDNTTTYEDWTASTILASVRIRGPICQYAYSPRMKELLYSPKMYGKINLIIQSKFQSSYSLALYENCVRYRELPHTKWFDLELFRKLMGIAPDKYIIFKDLKKRVIDKALEEINKYSDLLLEPDYQKIGRQVCKIRFKLELKYKKARIGKGIVDNKILDLSKDEGEILALLTSEFAFQPARARELLGEYGCNYIRQKIEIVKSNPAFKAGKIHNITAYVLHALKHDYLPQVAGKVSFERKDDNKVQNLARADQKRKEAYEKYKKEEIEKAFNNLPIAYRDSIQKDYLATIEQNGFLFEKFRKHGFASGFVEASFRDYFIKKYASELPTLLSFEEFKA